MVKEAAMKKTNQLSALLVIDVIAFAIVWMMPFGPAVVPVRGILLAVFAAAAMLLSFMLSRSRTVQPHVRIKSIEPVSRINPAQFF